MNNLLFKNTVVPVSLFVLVLIIQYGLIVFLPAKLALINLPLIFVLLLAFTSLKLRIIAIYAILMGFIVDLTSLSLFFGAYTLFYFLVAAGGRLILTALFRKKSFPVYFGMGVTVLVLFLAFEYLMINYQTGRTGLKLGTSAFMLFYNLIIIVLIWYGNFLPSLQKNGA